MRCMNIPLKPQKCQLCKETQAVTFMLGSHNFEWTCSKCGNTNYGILDLDFNVGSQIWVKAGYELTQTKDFSMAVVLAAIAVDCDLSFLYKKWTGIERRLKGCDDFDDEEYAEKLRKMGGIKDRLRTVSNLLVPGGVENFVNTEAKWSAQVDAYPPLSRANFVSSLERELFWPRNKILHGGEPISEPQAKLCVQIARLCLEIFLAMDYAKRGTVHLSH